MSKRTSRRIQETTGGSASPQKVMEQLILETIFRHMKDKKIRSS